MEDFIDPRFRRRGLRCCRCISPFSPKVRRCFDPLAERPRFFREECRDCFWPIFTHPGWLCCDIHPIDRPVIAASR